MDRPIHLTLTVYYYGDFYMLSGVPCRSTLEIFVERAIGNKRANLSSRSPDVVVSDPPVPPGAKGVHAG